MPKTKQLRNKRRRAWIAGGRRCFFCGREIAFEETTTDHLMPASEGGSNAADNLVAACLTCNQEKDDTTINPVWWVALQHLAQQSS